MTHPIGDADDSRLVRMRQIVSERKLLTAELESLILASLHDRSLNVSDIAEAAGYKLPAGIIVMRRKARAAGMQPRRGGRRRART